MREIKFRAWHKGAKEMIYADVPSHALRWLEEGQPVEVMQYTGFKDRNDKEIYEGDFVGLGSMNGIQTRGEVEFHNGCFLIHIEGFGHHSLNRALLTDPIYANTGTVIGNIHENPELFG